MNPAFAWEVAVMKTHGRRPPDDPLVDRPVLEVPAGTDLVLIPGLCRAIPR